MNIKNKPLPKFEVPASYEKYAEGGYLMDMRESEPDSFAAHNNAMSVLDPRRVFRVVVDLDLEHVAPLPH